MEYQQNKSPVYDLECPLYCKDFSTTKRKIVLTEFDSHFIDNDDRSALNYDGR